MYKPSFRGCETLIHRAKQHRDSLEECISTQLRAERNNATLRADLDPKSGHHIISVKTVPDLSEMQEQVSAMVGDAVCNLRFSLDHLAWQLACVHTDGNPQWPHRIQFPIEDDPGAFAKRCQRRGRGWISEIAPSIQAEIEKFQPYRGIDGQPDSWSGPYIHQLALLRNLSNVHKHRNLTSVYFIPNAFETYGFQLAMSGGGARLPDISFSLNRMELGAEVMRARFVGNVEPHVDMAGHFTPSITLDEGRPIEPTLDRIAAYVTRVLRHLQPMV